VLVANLGYTLTFGRHDSTVFSRALIADIALPFLLLAQLPWMFGRPHAEAAAHVLPR